MPSVSSIAEDIEDTLFNKVTHYDYHIAQSYLPDQPDVHYSVREYYHKALIVKTVDLKEEIF